MSKLVARMKKLKSANLNGIGLHNLRKTKNHTNENIDTDKSHLNYDLCERGIENYKTEIENYINENKKSTRAVRKDAVEICEWVITSDKDFFKDLSQNDIKYFFETAKNYFSKNFGEENIQYAVVHLDEKTPHMHLGVVPFDKEKNLSAKRVFTRNTLFEIQDELPLFLKKHGFNIERGEKLSKAEHLDPEEFKKATLKNKVAELQEENKKLENEINNISADIQSKFENVKIGKQWISNVDKIKFRKNVLNKEEVIISNEDFQKLKKSASKYAKVVDERDQLDRSRTKSFKKQIELENQLSERENRLKAVIKESMDLTFENDALSSELGKFKGVCKHIPGDVWTQAIKLFNEELELKKQAKKHRDRGFER